jgi:DNA-directed RNA polymerase subunit RPC12/RpoP
MSKEEKHSEIYDSCPHCGQKLSPWQQVLLGVDRALTCKNCWYRIILEPPAKNETGKKTDKEKSKFEE